MRPPLFDRAWLLTWTAYGNWLPGDERGFVGYHHDEQGAPVLHNLPGTPYDRDVPALRAYARRVQKQATVRLPVEHADALAAQFRETARFRGWLLPALAIMPDHVHLVVLVPGDPEPARLLHSFKSNASRQLNAAFGAREWWTTAGSTESTS